jgi:thiol:disulfide interchange protein DsbD
VEIHLRAALDDSWHIYSQRQPEGAIAIPTNVAFRNNPLVTIMGMPKEMGDKEKYEDANAGIIQYQYTHELDLVEKVVLKARVKTTVSGIVSYQVCTNRKCLPPKEVSFNIKLD